MIRLVFRFKRVFRANLIASNSTVSCAPVSTVSKLIFPHLLISFIAIVLVGCAGQKAARVNLNTLDVAVYEETTSTQLMNASRAGDVSGIRQALANGDKLNAIGPEGSAFSMAVDAKQFSIAAFLVDIGAEQGIGFEEGEISPLMLASSIGHNRLVEALLDAGVDVNYRDWREHSALSLATINGHLTTMKTLIGAGANVNIDAEGRSLLQHAVADNNSILAQLLIRSGADVNYRNAAGETALRIARRGGFFDLDLMLVQSGAE